MTNDLSTVGFLIGAATDVGVSRDLNQDSYGTTAELVVVADGMGGHRGGEIASSLAVEEVLTRFDRPDLAALVDSVEYANRRILDAAAANPQLHGMGTTVVALGLLDVADEGTRLGVINVGDSRMYRLSGRELEQLTEDHSLVETLVREGRLTPDQAKDHPQRNIVTRALGVLEQVEVDHHHFIPKVGDRYLLCSDGLFNEVHAIEIATILATYADPQETANALVAAANAKGGRDNITTVVVEIVEADRAQMPRQAQALASSTADFASVPNPNDDAVAGMGVGAAAEPAPVAEADQASPEATTADKANSGKQRWSWRR